ncbi:hypothetical protein EXS74_01375 [Candidatus Woesearchaeota archaeon]|nr:hypothetical protein [Candidatus Woesearchaeota archaeon]
MPHYASGSLGRGMNLEKNMTWGMIYEGFQSLEGIPDNFYSAEDPEDRRRLWNNKRKKYSRGEDFLSGQLYRD